jgi:putative transferase (TIGR04331 family)
VAYTSLDAGEPVTAPGSQATANPPIEQRRVFGRISAGARAFLQRDGEPFIISSYLPPLRAGMLSLLLGHVPWRRRSPPVRPASLDMNLRATNRLDSGANEGFAAFVRDMLLEVLPTCFLEGFGSLMSQVEEARWPRRPRFIFTSSSFDTAEVFKLWTAEKVEEGRPYIIGQHGNNYGTARYCPSETECVETGDAFLTWGWRDESRRCRPSFVFRTAGRSRGAWNPRGGVLLIEDSLPHLQYPWDPYPNFSRYQREQFEFVESLPDAVRRATIVRLHAGHRKQPWCDAERWRRRQPRVTLDDGSTPISALVRESRVVVHSYDSTGILETLSLNLPTLCFWNGGLAHLRDSAVPYYQLLATAGILQDTPQSAARKVADVWDDVGAWWGSEAVQGPRKKFIEQYAKTATRPVRSLKRLLVESASAAGAG